jgi:hypothetical protein
MVFFIFILVLMFSLSGVLYLTVRALPRMAEINGAAAGATETGDGGISVSMSDNLGAENLGLLDRWANSTIPEKIDAVFNEWLLKFLRRFKVVTLKLDNLISARLHKIRREHETAEKKAAIDFKEIAEKKDGE